MALAGSRARPTAARTAHPLPTCGRRHLMCQHFNLAVSAAASGIRRRASGGGAGTVARSDPQASPWWVVGTRGLPVFVFSPHRPFCKHPGVVPCSRLPEPTKPTTKPPTILNAKPSSPHAVSDESARTSLKTGPTGWVRHGSLPKHLPSTLRRFGTSDSAQTR